MPRIVRRPSGENHDRNRRGGGLAAQDFANAEAVDVGEHEVQENQVGSFLLDAVERFATAGRSFHRETRFGQMKADEVGDVPFVIDAENSRTHVVNLRHVRVTGVPVA